jgi:hypothetical protein
MLCIVAGILYTLSHTLASWPPNEIPPSVIAKNHPSVIAIDQPGEMRYQPGNAGVPIEDVQLLACHAAAGTKRSYDR